MKANVEILGRDNLDFAKVKFYTLRLENETEDELTKFYRRYEQAHLQSVNYLKMWIVQVGEKYSAEPRFFRPEDNTKALPPPSKLISSLELDVEKSKMKLRLYCIVLSSEIAILVSGGVKESDATRDSPSC